MLNIPLMKNNITQDDKENLINFIKESDHFTNGQKVREFEDAWSKWLGVRHTVFVNSGSSANFITMAVLADLYGKGEVIVPPITWSSDIASVMAAGHKPVFVDINMTNLAMNEEEIVKAITPATKAVFLTHVLGFNGLGQSLIDELKARNILLIEDVCESHGASYKGKKCGTLGFASNFSFYYAHHMSTIEGGAICTDDDEFYEYCRLYRSHGMLRESTDASLQEKTLQAHPDLNPEFMFLVPGYNMRSTELNAVIGLNQLKRLNANNEKRIKNFSLFLNNLDPEKYFTNFDTSGSVNYAFVIVPTEKNQCKFKDIINLLKNQNVEFRRGTAGGGNMIRQPFIRKMFPELIPENYPNAEIISFYGLYTGNYPDLENEKIIELADLLNKI